MKNNDLINDEKIIELYKRLRPIVTVNEAKFLIREYTLEELKKRSFVQNKNVDKKTYIDNSEIEIVGAFNYMKEYQNPLSFNPTIGEILSEIPRECSENADAFEINGIPRIVNNYHVADVLTYKIHKK